VRQIVLAIRRLCFNLRAGRDRFGTAQDRIYRVHHHAPVGNAIPWFVKGGSIEKLDAWLHDAQLSGIYAMQRFARAARQDIDAVRNAVLEPWSNGQTEGQINRLKAIKRAMYGRAGIELLRARMIPLYQVDLHQE